MSFLLDTHVVLFANVEPHRIPKSIEPLLVAGANDLFVSAVSWYEVELKASRSQLSRAVADSFTGMVRAMRAIPLNLLPEHAERAGKLPLVVKDPFDRFIAAQAVVTGLTVISADRAFDQLGAGRRWK